MNQIINYLRKFDCLRNNTFQKEFFGTIGIIQSIKKYKENPANLNAEETTSRDDQDFKSFFIQVEEEKLKRVREVNKNYVAKNVTDVEIAGMRGNAWIEYLQSHDLEKSSTVLDYGCGGLRLGKSMIEYLDPGKYTGVDITDLFLNSGGLTFLGEQNLVSKEPFFSVIDSPHYNTEIGLKKFDFIYSTMVVMHVPPAELESYFRKVLNHMHSKSLFFFDFQPSLFTFKKNSLTWGYSYRKIYSIIKDAGAKSEVAFGNMVKVVLK